MVWLFPGLAFEPPFQSARSRGQAAFLVATLYTIALAILLAIAAFILFFIWWLARAIFWNEWD